MKDYIKNFLLFLATLALVNIADSLFRLGQTVEHILEVINKLGGS